MAEIKAPSGAFLLVELDGSTPVPRIFEAIILMRGVGSVSDLATVSIDSLNERVLMRLSDDERRLYQRETRKAKAK